MNPVIQSRTLPRSTFLPVILLGSTLTAATQIPPPANAAYDAYVRQAEARLHLDHPSSPSPDPLLDRASLPHLHAGEPVIEKVTPAQAASLPGAMLHDWRGAAFAPGATAAQFEHLIRNFNAYPQIYAPQILSAHVASAGKDRSTVLLRLQQKHVLTVVLDTTYDVTYGRRGPRGGYLASRSTRVAEVDDAGTSKEHSLPPGQDHGYLWRLNTWWTYEERDGGLYLQIESVSLTRSIPPGLAWAVRPFLESVPRESLEFTLRKTCEALRRTAADGGGQ